MTDTLQSRLRSGVVTPADLDAAADRIDALEGRLKLKPLVQQIHGGGVGPHYAAYSDAEAMLDTSVGLSFYRDL